MIAGDWSGATGRRPGGWRGPGSTASRSSPRTGTCPRSSSIPGPTCATTGTAGRWRTGRGSCARRSRRPGDGVGPGLAVGVRISVGELSPDGLTADEAIGALALIDADGVADYISVVAGTSETLAGSDHIVPPMTVAPGYTAPLAARVKAVVPVPVLVAGRINQPQDAELILARGDADGCVMTRALICDPELPAKAAAGATDEIRACVGCNQACIGHFHAGYPISCIQRPETGRELRYGFRVPRPAARGTWSWSAAGQAGSRPARSRPSAGTGSRCWKRASGSAGRCCWHRICRGGRSSAG